jgi:hypothetical protein
MLIVKRPNGRGVPIGLLWLNTMTTLFGKSVVDQPHVDADPDSTYHPDADPDSDFYLMRMRIRIRLFTLMRI